MSNFVSPLLLLRSIKSCHRNSWLQICDPEQDNMVVIKSITVDEVKKTISLLSTANKNQDPNLAAYTHWFNRGWSKALDYYLASKT